MKATASSKSRFGAPAPTVPTGLRPNLNGSTYISSARPATARGDYAGGVPVATRSAPASPTRAGRAAGVADLNSFRARLNIVKRESMMRQSMIMPHQQDAVMAPIAEGRPNVSSARPRAPPPSSSDGSFGVGAFEGGFSGGGDGFGGGGDGNVQEMNRRNFEDPEFVEQLERCLHWRPKALKGYDMKAVKEEARVTINMLKQCLQQSLVRKENMVEDLMRAERDRDQGMEGVKLQMESANASAQAAERELAATRTQMESARAAANAELGEVRAAREEAESELKRLRESSDFDRRRLEDDFEAKEVELGNLKRRHEESQETLRSVRADLAEVREALSRAERETTALRRDRENGESAYGAERKALEAQIRAKIDEVAAERAERSKQRAEFDDKLREANAEVERLTVQNKMLNAAAEEAEEGGRRTQSSLSAKLAELESELESARRELTRERNRFEETERELGKNFADAHARADNLEAKLATAMADAASHKQKLAAAVNGAEDAAIEAEDAVAKKAAELGAATKELEKAAADLAARDAAVATLEADLAAATEKIEQASATLDEERDIRREEKARLDAEIDRFKTEASENKGRADALLAQQSALMADVKEERARVAKMEDERKLAIEGGASAAEQARQQAREDLKAAEDRHAKAREEMLVEKNAAVEAMREKTTFEVQTARDAAAASLAAAEKDAEAKIAEAEKNAEAKIAEAEEKLAEARKSSADATEALEKKMAEASKSSEETLEVERTAAKNALAAAETAKAELEAKLAAAESAAEATKSALEANAAQTANELETERAAKTAAEETLAALEEKNAAAAAAASEAEEKHAELVEQAASAEARVQGVVAQLEYERKEVDRLEKEAREAAEAAEAASKEREEAAKIAAAERADMLSELKALRAATGIGDDGEELDEEIENAVEQADMSAKDASALTSRLVKATKAAEAAKRVATDMESFKKLAEDRLARIEELEQQALDADATRRALHNQIQELRGNVRVFCRVRPTTSDTACVECPADGSSVAITRNPGDAEAAGFEFDRVFGPESTQAEVFEEVSQLVQSALDGYKVCLFSYGQTGSGKTHTMLGEQSDPETRGIIPRAVAKVVEASKANAKKGWTYEMRASYVEIYNEQVRDLLKAGSGHSDKHSIVHTPQGVTEVSGVQREPVESVEAAAGLVRRAAAARAVEATQMNAVSSRSHTIFMLYITGEHAASGSKLAGCLNLVDLAGSERVGRSGAEGARLKEACAINKSLSCLGDVFQALSNKQSHVPYRNSKLTYLLQPCLGGDGKTLMFVNINPEAPSAEESMCSLKFASQVNAVELGGGRGAKRNIISGMAGKEKAEDKAEEGKKRRPATARAGTKEKAKETNEEAPKKKKRPETARPATGATSKRPKRG